MIRRLTAILALAIGLSAQAGERASARAFDDNVCVRVRIGESVAGSYLGCLNDQLAGLVEGQVNSRATMRSAADKAAAASPTSMGLFNTTATRQRLAGSFGRSVIPFRPERSYHSPLIPPRAGR